MTLGFIDEKGCLDENKLKKYVKMQLSLTLTKCDFGREIFVEFIMAEIIYLFNSGKFSDEKLKNRIYHLFKDYKSKCNCSKNDLKIIGISHLNSKYGFEVDLGEKKYECEANYVCDNFIGIFVKKNINNYNVTKSSLTTYFVNGLDLYVRDYYKEKSKGYKTYSLNDKAWENWDGEDIEMTREDFVKSEDSNPEEAYEKALEEAESANAEIKAKQIAKEILDHPNMVTSTAWEVLITYIKEEQRKGEIDYKDVAKIFGKKAGSVSKNIKDLSDRIMAYLGEHHKDFIREPEYSNMIRTYFWRLLLEKVKQASFVGKGRKAKRR